MLIDFLPDKTKQSQPRILNETLPKNDLNSQKPLFFQKKLKENCETLKKTMKFSLILRKKSIHKAKESSQKTTNTNKTLSKPNIRAYEKQLDTEETVINSVPIKKEGLKFGKEPTNTNVYYLEKMLETYQNSEKFSPKDFLKHQTIDEITRSKMIDWMIEVLASLNCSEETLFLAVNLMDRYFSIIFNQTVSDLHLIGTTCMFIASKYEEVYPLKLDTILEKIAHRKFSKEQLKSKELEILETLDFDVYGPNLIKLLGLSNQKIVIKGLEETFPLCLFEKALSYFSKMVLYEYNLIGRLDIKLLTSGILYTALKLVETVNGVVNFEEKVFIWKETFKVEIKDMVEISNEIFLLTQRFDQSFANNNLKRFNVDFFMELNERRKK